MLNSYEYEHYMTLFYFELSTETLWNKKSSLTLFPAMWKVYSKRSCTKEWMNIVLIPHTMLGEDAQLVGGAYNPL